MKKKLIALLAVFAVLLYNVIPITKVFADNEYTVTFNFEDGYTGETANEGKLIDIRKDEQSFYTELRTDSQDNSSVTGDVSCLPSGLSCTITVSDGTPTYLTSAVPIYDGDNKFNLANQISENKTFTVKSDNVVEGMSNVNFGSASWTVGEVTVTASIENIEIGTNEPVLISNDAVITLTNFDSSTMNVFVQAEGGFSTFLNPANDGTVRLTDLPENTVLPPENLTFSVVGQNSQQPPQPQQTSHEVNFGSASWTVGEVTVTASIDNMAIGVNTPVEIQDDTVITLTNFDSSTMDVKIQSEDEWFTTLIPAGDGTVRLTDLPDENVHLPAGTLTFSVVEKQQQQPVAMSHNVNFGSASWVVGETTVTASIDNLVIGVNTPVEIQDDVVITLTNFDSSTMDVKVEAEGGFNTILRPANDGTVRLTDLDPEVNLPGEVLTFSVIARQNGGGEEPQGGNEDIDFDIKFTDTYVNIRINDIVVIEDDNGNRKNEFVGTIDQSGTTNSSETNVIKIETCFGEYPINSVEINGVTYTSQSENVTVNNELWTITVPGAASYTIRGAGDTSVVVPRTIIWVNPDYVPKNAEDAQWVSDFTISHGEARIIEVYDENGTLLDPAEYVGQDADEFGLDKGFGWAQFKPGYRVVFEFVPEYGYQLTGIAINEMPLDAIDDVNRFEIQIPNDVGVGNLHFAATFTETDDVVNADSENVKSGSIKLGKNLDAGSAVLTVKDVDLDSSKIKGFENAAKDYEVKTFLDIDLYNVFYKGKNDSEDVWSEKIDELDKEATITIRLEKGVNGNDIVIVHNVHDGDEFEVIPTTYNPKTNTITFKTKSFSNYAIASRTVNTSNPITGDNIMIFVILLGVSIVGLISVKMLQKKKQK